MAEKHPGQDIPWVGDSPAASRAHCRLQVLSGECKQQATGTSVATAVLPSRSVSAEGATQQQILRGVSLPGKLDRLRCVPEGNATATQSTENLAKPKGVSSVVNSTGEVKINFNKAFHNYGTLITDYVAKNTLIYKKIK